MVVVRGGIGILQGGGGIIKGTLSRIPEFLVTDKHQGAATRHMNSDSGRTPPSSSRHYFKTFVPYAKSFELRQLPSQLDQFVHTSE